MELSSTTSRGSEWGLGKLKLIVFTFTTLTETNSSFCTENHNNNVVEDEEHVLFHCPEYDICRQEYPELFWGTNINMKNISDYDNQETIAQLLWNIRMTRIRLGVEC